MDISNKIPAIHPKPEISSVQAKNKSAQPIQPPPQGDRVELSVQGKQMQAARQAISQMPDVDLDKVAKIKAQLQQGQYQVDAQKTAAKMIMESLVENQKK